jgi:hypothetical protein
MKTFRLSKSKILSGLQCPKRLWLEIHRPDLIPETPPEVQQRFDTGHLVNDVARALRPGGILIDTGHSDRNLKETRRLLTENPKAPLFEATFTHRNVMVRADILQRRRGRWHLTEVKSAASVKEPNLEDCAVQSWVLDGAGLNIASVHLAHINTEFVYPGGGDYQGLFVEVDVGENIGPLIKEVPRWVRDFQNLLKGKEPDIDVGDHCTRPYKCPFLDYCAPESTDYPVTCLPRGRKIAAELLAEGIDDIRDVPAGRLGNGTHEWVRRVTIAGRPEIRPEGLAALKSLPYPRYFLDFETVSFAVPIWPGTRPYQQLPFQWSCHIEDRNGKLTHQDFLDTSGEPPMRRCAEALIKALRRRGPILVYSSFEAQCLRKLAECCPDLAPALQAIGERLYDLLPVVQQGYYHPEMRGSWSLKAVLPTIAPHLDYSALGEIQEGGAAATAYLELIQPDTGEARRAQLETDLRAYCRQDTLGLVEIARRLAAT